MSSIRKVLTCLLAVMQFAQASQAQQTADPAATRPAASVETLRVRVLQGAGGTNNTRTGMAAPIVVEIRDHNERPVEGAEVTCTLPATGPGGFYPGNQLSLTTKTNFQGQAGCSGFRPNMHTGRFEVKIAARFDSHAGAVVVQQTNSERGFALDPPRRSRTKLWIALGVIGAGAAGGGVYYFTQRNKNDQTISIVPGTISLGGPR